MKYLNFRAKIKLKVLFILFEFMGKKWWFDSVWIKIFERRDKIDLKSLKKIWIRFGVISWNIEISADFPTFW